MSEDVRHWRRRLPHFEVRGSVYFITFRLKDGELSSRERDVVLHHVKKPNGTQYHLFAVVVMPDHVHMIVKPFENVTLTKIVKGIKGTTARKINRGRNRTGAFWLDEWFDRVLRDEKEFYQKLTYIWENPMKVGLVVQSREYRWLYIGIGADS